MERHVDGWCVHSVPCGGARHPTRGARSRVRAHPNAAQGRRTLRRVLARRVTRATDGAARCLTSMDGEFDLRDTRGRLKKLALAALIGAVLTFFTVRAMMSSGHGNHDPVGASIM